MHIGDDGNGWTAEIVGRIYDAVAEHDEKARRRIYDDFRGELAMALGQQRDRLSSAEIHARLIRLEQDIAACEMSFKDPDDGGANMSDEVPAAEGGKALDISHGSQRGKQIIGALWVLFIGAAALQWFQPDPELGWILGGLVLLIAYGATRQGIKPGRHALSPLESVLLVAAAAFAFDAARIYVTDPVAGMVGWFDKAEGREPVPLIAFMSDIGNGRGGSGRLVHDTPDLAPHDWDAGPMAVEAALKSIEVVKVEAAGLTTGPGARAIMRNHTNGRLVTVTARVGVPASGTIMPDILFIAVKPLAPGEEGEFIGELPQKPRNNGLTAAPTGLRLDAYDRKGEFEKGLSAWLGE